MTAYVGANPNPDGEPSRQMLAAVGLNLIPGVGGALARIYDHHVGERRAERAREMGDVALSYVEGEELVRRLSADERLSDVFVRAIDAATRTAHDGKRRAMGRVVGEAAADSARIDETELLV